MNFLPWNQKVGRASPRQWLLLKLAGDQTVVVNAKFVVSQASDGGYLSTLANVEGDTLVAGVKGLHLPGVKRHS